MLDHNRQLNTGSSPLPVASCHKPTHIGGVRCQPSGTTTNRHLLEIHSGGDHQKSPDGWQYPGTEGRQYGRKCHTNPSRSEGTN